ncbi:unnamed protein product [Orchesella dallaii]|uniref:Uncharacterized protein n=1 Tax=Orchesella dallaii TaxID=48710 RepID=A0ABP1S8K1_9HEXA
MLWKSAFVVLLSVILHFSSGQDAVPSKLYEVDEEMYNMYKDRLCKVLPFAGGATDLPPWSDTLTEDEIYELAFLTLGHQLTSDAVAQIPTGNLGWKQRIVDIMGHITQRTCNNEGLSPAFISVTKNLFLYYLVKYEKSLNKTEIPADDYVDQDAVIADKWKEIIEAVSSCAMELEPINFNDQCGMFDSFQDHDGNMVLVTNHKEQFDVEMETTPHAGMDYIVDSLWWMFSITYARCYSFFYPNEDVILVFLQRFRDDILSNFAGRWRGAGELDNHFDLIFGPLDMDQEYSNLRKCAGASFEYEGLGGRELVRPLTVMVENTVVRNFKVMA